MHENVSTEFWIVKQEVSFINSIFWDLVAVLHPKFLSSRQIYYDLLLWQSFCGFQMLKRQVEKDAIAKLYVTVVS